MGVGLLDLINPEQRDHLFSSLLFFVFEISETGKRCWRPVTCNVILKLNLFTYVTLTMYRIMAKVLKLMITSHLLVKAEGKLAFNWFIRGYSTTQFHGAEGPCQKLNPVNSSVWLRPAACVCHCHANTTVVGPKFHHLSTFCD